MKSALAPILACLALPALADVDRVIDAEKPEGAAQLSIAARG